jgi:hypothetical protein
LFTIAKHIKYKLLEREWEKILRKSRHPSWDLYWYWNDLDLNCEGQTPKEVLAGFQYTVEVPFDKLDIHHDPMWGEIHRCETIEIWCRSNCQDKVRWVWNSRLKNHIEQYLPLPSTGIDFLTFGFKNEKDYVWFSLKWL